MANEINVMPKDGEEALQYLWRVGSYKTDGLTDISWAEIANIINEKYSDGQQNRGESAYRKSYASARKFYDEIFSKTEDEDLQAEYEEQRRELERLKTQYRDERSEWSRQNRVEARISESLDLLGDKLAEIGKCEFPDFEGTQTYESDNDIVVLLSDWHLGKEFDNYYGKYNSSIAKYRLQQLANEVLKIQQTNKCKNCYILCVGDLVNGSFRNSIRVSNKENIVDQIKAATELLVNFCHKMCEHFGFVYFVSVAGNHSRLFLGKDDDCMDERLDDLIAFSTTMALKSVRNFVPLDANIDNSLATFLTHGLLFCLVHGDNKDTQSENGILKLMGVLGQKPDVICCGHMHTCNYAEYQDVQIVRGGCLCGSGDEFERSHRFKNSASQMVMVINDDGIQSLYPVKLK